MKRLGGLLLVVALALPFAPPTAAQEGTGSADPDAPSEPASPLAPAPAWKSLPGDAAFRRWSFSLAYGGAAAGAPDWLVGAGYALGRFAGTRVEVAALVGTAPRGYAVPVDPAWNDGFRTYKSATLREHALVLELTGARPVGALELWGGAGAHLSFPELGLTYTHYPCSDILHCSTVPVEDSTTADGKPTWGLALSGGARWPLARWLLLSAEARWLVPVHSRVDDLSVRASLRVGGFAVLGGLVFRGGEAL